MKKFLLTKTLLLATICLQAQTLYVQPIDGEQIGFSIIENPKITFGNGTMTINETQFQLANVQNLSFVKNAVTSIVAVSPDNKIIVFPNPVANDLHIVIPNDVYPPNTATELFDINGRRVFSQRINCQLSIVNCQFVIDMTPFPNGTYILRIANQSLQIIKTQ